MYVNKFGGSLSRANGGGNGRSIDSLRGYVRNSALCLNPDHYDAKKRRIVRVATPCIDTDATNKDYIDNAFVDRDKSLERVRGDVEEVRKSVNGLTEDMNSLLRNRVEILSRNVDSLQTSQGENENVFAKLREEIERLSRTNITIESLLEDLRRQIRETTVSKTTLTETVENLKDSFSSTATRAVREENKLGRGQFISTIEKLKNTTNQTLDKRVKDVLEKWDKTIANLKETTNRRIDERVRESRETLSTVSKLDDNIKSMVTQAAFESTIADLRDNANKRIENSATTLREAIEKTLESVRSDIERLSRSSENALADLNKRHESLVTKEMLIQELDRQREFTTGDILKAKEHLKRTLTRQLGLAPMRLSILPPIPTPIGRL